MNSLTRCVCLGLPAGVVLSCFMASEKRTAFIRDSRLPRLAQRLWWAIPFVVLAVRAQAGETDRRPLKFWIPYGMMCKNVAEQYGYVIDHGQIITAHDHDGYKRTLENEKTFSSPVRILRRWMPYGLVLWWDRTNRASTCQSKASAVKPFGRVCASQFDIRALSRQIKQLDDRVRRLESLVETRFDSLEIQILKLRAALAKTNHLPK